MKLITHEEIVFIAKQYGFSKVYNWAFEEIEDKIIGYLGDYINLIIEVESKGIKSEIKLFVKCLPRYDKWKAKYLEESWFFKKEYMMLSKLFKEFNDPEGLQAWRPKSLLIKKNLFVFENVSLQGYKMPHHQDTMILEELKAAVEALARFHAQTYILEEKKSKELGRPYRIWEDYSDYLQEPRNEGTKKWRDTGRNAVIDFLKVFSVYKSKSNFSKYIESAIPDLFDRAVELMSPSSEYRNVVVHRDLWTNNIFLKKIDDSNYHSIFVDFQTVLYCSPMIDLSSLIYFNTSRTNRHIWSEELIYFYYSSITRSLEAKGVRINDVFQKNTIMEQYEKSLIFAITQASLIIPITAMSREKREEIFWDPKMSEKANLVSRSEEFIQIAREDITYRNRITELFDEIVERFVFLKEDEVKL